MRIDIPNYVKVILKRLQDYGYSAYVVGGCVRDSLMGIEPHDWDVCSDSTPQNTKELFKDFNVIDTGLMHGTVTIMSENNPVEVTTFREEKEYIDNRRPSEVVYIRELKGDLARRDFTINAMAYNDELGLQDFYGGYDDLKKGEINCVGDANLRLSEDALRIMRAIRFSSQFSFSIGKATKNAIKNNFDLLEFVSQERKASELCKILTGEIPHILLEQYYDVFAFLLPEITAMKGFEQKNPHHMYDVWEHTLKAIENSDKNIITRLVMLFHDSGKPYTFTVDDMGIGHFRGHEQVSVTLANKALSRLKFDKATIKLVTELIKLHDLRIENSEKSVKRFIINYGYEMFDHLMLIKKADIMGQNVKTIDEKMQKLVRLQNFIDELKQSELCLSIKNLDINGVDLIKMGFKPGVIIGEILNDVLELVSENKLENKKNTILEYVKEKYNI